MKICILTHSLHTNYGGLLQAYALQTVLKRMGHEVVTDKGSMRYISFSRRIVLFTYHFIKRYLLGSKLHDPFLFFFRFLRIESELIDRKISVNTNRFIDTNIDTIDFFQGRKNPSNQLLDKFDALVVGSDQIWRPLYKHVPTYFLDFTKGKKMNRIAYAASFGVDDWSEFTVAMTKECANAAKWFDAISVREESGVDLCKKYLGVKAIHLLDPTLLLDKDDYLSLIEKEDRQMRKRVLMCYILDKSIEKQAIINYVAEKKDLIPLEIMPKEKLTTTKKDITNCIYLSVSKWISGFRDAEFVVTDSFHGTIFAIIFKKPFISILNSKRGSARFISLLHIFNLENRLISSVEELNEQHFFPIDYDIVNNVVEKWKLRSMHFLISNLNFK